MNTSDGTIWFQFIQHVDLTLSNLFSKVDKIKLMIRKAYQGIG